MDDKSRAEAKLPRIYDIPLTEIDDFPDHPFQVRMDEDMDQLVESIKERGIITPITLRQKEDGRYELVSGHRRNKACELAGFETIKAEIRELTRDEAIILMVESNLQRSVILPSEKAFSYKMKLEAMSRQGQRRDLTCGPVGHKSRDVLAENGNDSARQISRYIRLTELIPSILEMVDEGRIVKQAQENTKRSIKVAQRSNRTIKQTAKSTGKASVKTAKGTIKTSKKAVKTAEATSKTAIKTTQATAKAAQKTAQASVKAAQLAVQAARATAKAVAVTAKAVAKATVAAVKGIIAGVKALVAAIAAGGWVAVVAIVIICLIALIVASCFGIFFSSEDTGSDQTMQQVVQEINEEYLSEIDRIKDSVTYDELEMSGARAVWPEVLSIYAVKTTTDPDNPQEVASITDEKIELLRDIFWAMNDIDYRTEEITGTEIIETDDGNGNIVEEVVEVTEIYLYITVSHKNAEEMAAEYNFSDDQLEQLEALLDDENNSLWTAVLYGISTTDDQIVAVALSQIGNVGGQPYWSWYGFGSRVEWCACFVSWCANECGYIDTGVIPKFAGCVNGVNWFRDRGQWADNSAEPTPGMIIFFDWDNPSGSSGPQDGLSDHVGIVEKVENGRVYTIEGNSGDSCRRRDYPLGYYEILGYGIPAY